MVNIVFVGVGSMGQMAHLKNYVILPDVRVVAIVEARKKLADAVAARYAIPHVFYDLDSFRASGIAFDGIVSAQQYRNMAAVVPELLAFGKPPKSRWRWRSRRRKGLRRKPVNTVSPTWLAITSAAIPRRNSQSRLRTNGARLASSDA